MQIVHLRKDESIWNFLINWEKKASEAYKMTADKTGKIAKRN